MKAIAAALIAAALIATPMAAKNAHAQFELMFGGGANSPLGEFGDQAGVGYAFMTGAGFKVTPFLVIGGEVGLYGNSASDDFLSTLSPGTDMSTRMINYAGMAKLMVPFGNHNVFAKGLYGTYRASAKVTSPLSPSGPVEIETDEMGYGLGGGFMISNESSWSLLLDITYHSVQFEGATTDTDFVTYMVGGIFSFSLD